MTSSFHISTKKVGDGAPCFTIAEIAQAHEGSLGFAHAFVDAAADVGADAVKFQTHIAAAESTLDEPFRVKFSYQDETRYAYWRRMEFTSEQWASLASHCAEKNLIFLSSPFSVEAVDLLSRIGMPAWKIASGELGSKSMLDAMKATDAPFLISSGMSSWHELDSIVRSLSLDGGNVAVLQCTTQYPTPLDRVGLNVLQEMRARYRCPVGLSDHTGAPVAAMAAIARGADVLEAHLTLDRRMFGPDVSSSLTVEQLRSVVSFRNDLAVIDANPVDKDRLADEFAPLRSMFRRSLAPVRPLSGGTIIAPDMLAAKKPSTGIPETCLNEVVGRRLRCDVYPDRLLRWEDLENGSG